MKKSVIYSRVSTEDQSFQSQIEDLQKYAKLNNLDVVKTFGEKVSGFDLSKDRIEFETMKQYVFENDIKEILIWELSRFGRSTLQTLNQIELFNNKGVNIFFKKDNINTLSDDVTNKLMLSMLSAIAELERNTIIERSRRGRISSALKGKRTGFVTMPYGYDADKDGYLIVSETEGKVVKQIFELAANGLKTGGIADILNSQNTPTRRASSGYKRTLRNGNKVNIIWKRNTLRNMLRNPLYKGERHYSGQIIQIPNIVDEALWDKVHEKYEKKLGYINRTKYDYLVKGKLYCGSCYLAYASRTDKSKPRVGLASYYYCPGRKDKAMKCKNGQMSSKVLDKAVYDLMLRHSEVMISIHKDNMDNFDITTKNNQIEFHLKEINNLDQKKNRIINLYKDGHIDETEFKTDSNKIKNDVILNERTIIQINKEIVNFKDYHLKEIDTFKNLASETNFDIQREFINKYVDKINIHKVSETEIDFTKLTYWDLSVDSPVPKKIYFNNPQKNEKLKYIELFAFGNPKPVKAVVSGVTMINYSSEKLELKQGVLCIL